MTPILVLNPSTDEAFVQVARAQLEGAQRPAALQVALRESYPQAVVRARELSGESLSIWYVYRDGRWVASRDERRSEDDSSKRSRRPPRSQGPGRGRLDRSEHPRNKKAVTRGRSRLGRAFR